MEQYDVIVIGAGNGGLAAAATLGKKGKKVLVLEKHNLPGGCATSYVRGRFEFEASLHELCQMGEERGLLRRTLEGLGLDVDWVASDEAFRCVSLDPDEPFDVTLPADVRGYLDAVEAAAPGSLASMTRLMELSRMIQEGIEWLDARGNDPKLRDLPELLANYADLLRLVPVPVDEALRRLGVPDKAREIYESYWNYLGVDSTKMSFAVYASMTYSYLTQKPWLARYRSHELSLAFDDAIRRFGGAVWYNSEAARIRVSAGLVEGVELTDGRFLPCRHVISNLMPSVVFGRMMEESAVPEREKKLLRARELGQSPVTVSLGLDIPYEELGFRGYDVYFFHDADTSAQYANASSLGNPPDFTANVLNAVIPDASPAGTTLLQLTRFYTGDPFADVREEDYFTVKDRVAAELIAEFERLTDVRIRGHIEEIAVTTPVTWARYLGTPRGCVYGYAGAPPDGLFARARSAEKLDYTLRGLRFCGGHGSQLDGYSQAIESGRAAAEYTLKDLASSR